MRMSDNTEHSVYDYNPNFCRDCNVYFKDPSRFSDYSDNYCYICWTCIHKGMDYIRPENCRECQMEFDEEDVNYDNNGVPYCIPCCDKNGWEFHT
jgi:hypothetical protein